MHDFYSIVEDRAEQAAKRYGPLASTHEGLGVAFEEWNELCEAVRSNNIVEIKHECLDLAAVLMRLAIQLDEGGEILSRSGK